MNNLLYLIIACYNEQEVLPETARQLSIKINHMIDEGLISKDSKIVFVNDGSKDKTWEIIHSLHRKNKLFSGISLSHNSGEQNAYIAGMMTVKDKADMVITMDADLQDDINAIDEMVKAYFEGNEIVYGVRKSREKDSFFKKTTANMFYSLMNKMGTELIANHSQYRLMSKRAIEALSEYSEVNMFLPALVPLLGFKHAIVYHERQERFAGETKYSAGKLFSLAAEAVTSFTYKPLQFINILIFISLLAVLFSAVGMIAQALKNGAVSDWLKIFISLWSISALQLVAIRIVGDYVGRTYRETKKRPRYFIDIDLTK